MKTRIALFVPVLFSLQINAQTKTEPLPSLMHSFYSTIFELRPYISSPEKFADKKNKPKIGKLLKELSEKVSNSSSPEISESIGFNYTYSLLAQHIRDTRYLYDREFYSSAQNQLKATMGFCISCHDRLPKLTQYKSGNAGTVPGKDETFEDAEFYYIAHQFDSALAIFDKKISDFKKDDDLELLNRALVRKVTFYTRIAREPQVAVKSFTEDLKNKNLPGETQAIIKSWIKEFVAWQDELLAKPEAKSESKFLKEADTFINANVSGLQVNLAYPSLIKLLRVSGQLYEMAYNKKASEEKAEILYLLAKCERDLVSIRGYSLSDVYLKDCVTAFPKSKVARKCFIDYELSMKQKFNSMDSEYLNRSIEVLRRMIDKK